MAKNNTIETLSEEQIIERAILKDPVCQKIIYDKYSNKMMAVCSRYTVDYDEAKDVLQDAFIRIFDYLHQFGNKGSFEGWIRRVVVTTAINWYNKNKRRFDEVDVEQLDWDSGASFTPFNHQYTLEELHSLIKQLPPSYQMVFNMYAVDGYSHKEIGELMGISEGTSKSNLSRARVILQKKLKQLENYTYGQVK